MRKGEMYMGKMNCWEYKKCGRQEGGAKAHEMGVCPAAIASEADGFLGGKNGGRGCAYITGTFCGGAIQGTHNEKKENCWNCDFFQLVKKEHLGEMSSLAFAKYVKTKKGE